MLLTIDIGNTTTKFGAFADENLIYRITIPTDRSKSADQIYESIKRKLNHAYDDVIISSVVPEINPAFRNLIKRYFRCAAIFVDLSFDFGFTIKYNSPDSVGFDRLVAAFAAVKKYGKPCVVCDFGTATNIEVVNSKNEYIGGIITGGMNLLADALHARTSKLPQISLSKPEKTIGDSTVSAIRSGIYFGYIGLVDGLVKRIIGELGETPKIVGTGGLVHLIAEGSEMIEIVDESLVLDGLRMLYEQSK